MHIHFVAIGGSAMHSIALALHEKGHQISGSDDMIYEPSRSRLAKGGLLPEELGWFPEKITQEIDAVVLGMHARENNPELERARELGVRIFSYPEFLYEHSRNKTRVVIGGSHGKTTITSMILHVLKYHQKPVDYMVGAQLEGFETMVHLTEENDFIILEGDEYLSSPIDPRPKFHLYKANIALISGIAWDHINVFPSLESYVRQFELFVESIVKGGILVYNEEDNVLKEIIGNTTNTIRKHPYHIPSYKTMNGKTFLETPEGDMPIRIFGKHNLENLAGAKWICQHIGVDEEDFYEAISSFSGACRRMEKIAESANAIAFKDFAHSPSKVKATTAAVKQQYPEKKLLACLELHTFSSLNPSFLKTYKNSLDAADLAAVYYSPDVLQKKGMNPLEKDEVLSAFNKEGLNVFTDSDDFIDFLSQQDFENSILLLMSSGNFNDLDFGVIRSWIKQ